MNISFKQYFKFEIATTYIGSEPVLYLKLKVKAKWDNKMGYRNYMTCTSYFLNDFKNDNDLNRIFVVTRVDWLNTLKNENKFNCSILRRDKRSLFKILKARIKDGTFNKGLLKIC